MMRVRVLHSATLDKVNEISLDVATSRNGEYIVGRSSKSGLILDGSDVSRHHGKFFIKDGNYYYSDLNSVNGSLVNDKLAQTNQSYLLKSGDVVKIGEFVLIVEEISEELEALPATVLNLDWRSFADFDSSEVADRAAEAATDEVSDEVIAQASEAEIKASDVQAPDEEEDLEEEPVAVVSEPTLIQAPEELEAEELEQEEPVVIVTSTPTIIQVPDGEEELEAEIPEEKEAESPQVTNQATPEAVSTLLETVAQPPEEAVVSEDISRVPEEAEISEEIAQIPESQAFEIISKKYIALMAHDSKKSELVQLVDRHRDFLSKCLTIATPSISEALSQQTGVAISQKTPSVPVGGYQTVASSIGTGDTLAVILLRDFMSAQASQANEEALLRLCNINQVLVATNLPTAEAVIHYIKNTVTTS